METNGLPAAHGGDILNMETASSQTTESTTKPLLVSPIGDTSRAERTDLRGMEHLNGNGNRVLHAHQQDIAASMSRLVKYIETRNQRDKEVAELIKTAHNLLRDNLLKPRAKLRKALEIITGEKLPTTD
jgi:hypothetical protein